MTDARSPYRIGAVFMGLSGLLHLIAPVFAGFGGQSPLMFAIGIVILGGSWGLMQNWRWLAYGALLMMIGGSVMALTGVWALAPVPGWIYGAIFLVNWAAVVALFMVLWRPRTGAVSVG